MTFLVVDDSRPTRNLIKSYLSEINVGQKCFFLEAEDGETALKTMVTGHIDFVLLDWNLYSKMTGLDVLKAIRDTDKDIPIIMITGESGTLNVIEAIKCGANDFTTKPINKKTLFDKVLKAVSHMKQ
jgi:DNA-binding response OmpR family regulator